MESLKIILLCFVAAISYGICQDQITARVCVEYFTIGHPPVFATDDPTLLDFGWGFIATWWVGLLLGVPLALFARAGSKPPLTAKELLKPVMVLVVFIGLTASIAGFAGYVAAVSGMVWLVGRLAVAIPRERHTAFLVDAWAHTAAYGSGFLGGVILWGWTWRRRKWLAEKK